MTDQLLVPRELLERLDFGKDTARALQALPELRALLAQPAASEPKPVAIVSKWCLGNHYSVEMLRDVPDKTPLFTHPAPAGVVALLRCALPFLERHDDKGPAGEGWQSENLTDLIHAITVQLNGMKP